MIPDDAGDPSQDCPALGSCLVRGQDRRGRAILRDRSCGILGSSRDSPHHSLTAIIFRDAGSVSGRIGRIAEPSRIFPGWSRPPAAPTKSLRVRPPISKCPRIFKDLQGSSRIFEDLKGSPGLCGAPDSIPMLPILIP